MALLGLTAACVPKHLTLPAAALACVRQYGTQVQELYDVVIMGSGMVGSALAALLSAQPMTCKLKVAVVDQKVQPLHYSLPEHPDLRVSTITPASIQCIQQAGAWDDIQPPRSAAFNKMQIWETQGPGSICWQSQDVGLEDMGVVVENNLLQAALLSAAQCHGVCTSLIWPATVKNVQLPGYGTHSQASQFKAQSFPEATKGPSNSTQTQGISSMSSANGDSVTINTNAHSETNSEALASKPSEKLARKCSVSASAETSRDIPDGSLSSASTGSLAVVSLSDGRQLATRLLVAADGPNSSVRAHAGIRTWGWQYQQRGVVATVRTSDINLTAWQRFLPTGPLALLPVRDGYSNIVWSTTPQLAKQLEQAGPKQFAAAVNRALHDPPAMNGMGGAAASAVHSSLQSVTPMMLASLRSHVQSATSLLRVMAHSVGADITSHLVSFRDLGTAPGRTSGDQPPEVLEWVGLSPKSFPLQLKVAGRYVVPRLALVGDAAHSVHPLAGQGVNLGFADVACLASAIADAVETGTDIGNVSWLQDRYERPRLHATVAMVAALDGVRTAFSPQPGPLSAVRNLGLQVIDASGPVKNQLMRYAMGF